jgi:hypothetical protein
LFELEFREKAQAQRPKWNDPHDVQDGVNYNEENIECHPKIPTANRQNVIEE